MLLRGESLSAGKATEPVATVVIAPSIVTNNYANQVGQTENTNVKLWSYRVTIETETTGLGNDSGRAAFASLEDSPDPCTESMRDGPEIVNGAVLKTSGLTTNRKVGPALSSGCLQKLQEKVPLLLVSLYPNVYQIWL